ncbi:MAG: MFS transporter [Anaerolineales bacterium]
MATQFSIQENKPWKTTFFTIWSGQALSILGSQLVQFALIWHLTIKTGSATVLATASLVGMLPNVILGPFIGTLVDRWNRRWTMLLADSIEALATIALAVLFALDIVEVWHIYAVLFIRSLAGAFHANAMNACRTPDPHSGTQPTARRRAERGCCTVGGLTVGNATYARHPVY